MKLAFRIVAITILAGFPGAVLWGQNIPPVKAKALDDSEVVLPKPSSQQFLILVIGFSHKSGDACSTWGKRLTADYPSDARAISYQMAELQSAPSFVRGMILHGMRKDVPTAQHSRFVALYDHEADWKKAVNFSTPDDPYILIADPSGRIVWQTHGAMSEAGYAELKAAVAKFATKPNSP